MSSAEEQDVVCSDRSVYLITYSKADVEKIDTREKFANLFVQGFGEDIIVQWVCACEKHKDGQLHFHLAIKLKRMRRWKAVKENISKNHSIVVHFQSFHTNYYDAYSYVTKEDPDYVTSQGHPMLANSPQTKNASSSRKSLKREGPAVRCRPTKHKRNTIDVVMVYDIITTNVIKTERELFRLALQQKEEGKTDLMLFVLKLSDKRRSEILRTAWRIKNANAEIARSEMSILEILSQAQNSNCVCEGIWLAKAVETLEDNNINVYHFQTSIKNALRYGRQKGNNVMLIGPSNCGKTFVLKPLAEIYKCFLSPASGTFAWVGAEKAEVVFLNDLRWNDKLLPWSDFLNLLEGLPIHIAAPKTHFAEDLLWNRNTPIFATSSSRLRKYDGGKINDIETGMMDTRWVYYEFFKQIQDPEEIKACGKCFADFLIRY